MKKKPYTEADVEALLALRAEGMTEKQIAEALNRTYNSIHHKVKQLIKDGRTVATRDLRPITPDDISDIATAHHTTPELVQSVIDMMSVKTRGNLIDVSDAVSVLMKQGQKCVYFGVPISTTASTALPTRARIMRYNDGGLMWVSQMAYKMRGKLSHDMFVRSISAIYEHTIAKSV